MPQNATLPARIGSEPGTLQPLLEHSGETGGVELAPNQSLALVALMEGATVTGAAERARVDRTTVHRWLKDDAAFIAAYNAARADVLRSVRTELLKLGSEATRVLQETLNVEHLSPRNLDRRLKAALAVLKMLGADKPEAFGPTDSHEIRRDQRQQQSNRALEDLIAGLDDDA